MIMEFTSLMLHKLTQANESVKGTDQYNKYLMENSHKWSGKKSWHFDGFSIPHTTGIIICFNHKFYIKVSNPHDNSTERWEVNQAVRELFNL